VRSVPKLYNEVQLRLRESAETAVRKVRSWCEMVASLRGREPGRRGTSTGEEDTAVRAVVTCRVCEPAIAVYLLVPFQSASIVTLNHVTTPLENPPCFYLTVSHHQ
jgi:hypothetical protein